MMTRKRYSIYDGPPPPPNFMNSENVQNVICNLITKILVQRQVNDINIYGEFCELIISDMTEQIPQKN